MHAGAISNVNPRAIVFAWRLPNETLFRWHYRLGDRPIALAVAIAARRDNGYAMILSEAGLKLIEQSEGLVTTVYLDPAGIPTVGYGHRVRPQDNLAVGDTITQQQAEAFLAADVMWAEKIVSTLVTVPLTQGQFDALVDFTFNLGSGTFEKSSLLTLLNEGNYAAACDKIGFYYFIDHKPSNGLLNRRRAEQALFNSAPAPVPHLQST